MKITVMGAGAVGCYYGAMLARAGHAVTLIARQQHVDAIKPRRAGARDAAGLTERLAVTATIGSGRRRRRRSGPLLRQID